MLGLVLALMLILVAPALPAEAGPRPNIVVIVTDDMRASDWQALPRTRALLGARATMFPNFIITTPTCCPSRTSLLTGMYAHQHGIHTNHPPSGGYAKFRAAKLDRLTIAPRLKQKKYRTGMVGKFLNGYTSRQTPPRGWSQWFATTRQSYTNFIVRENGQTVRYKSGYLTDIQRKQAIKFIDATPKGQSFFLYFAPKAPHSPSIPAPRHRNAFAGIEVTRSPAFNEDDVSDKPAYVRVQAKLEPGRLDQEERRRLETLLAVDEAIVAIYNKVNQRGQLPNTYIFVLSDNGWTAGDHRLNTKGVPYDGSVRVPLLAIGPGFVPGAVDDRLVGNIDLAVTIAGIAGVALPRADGESLFTVNRDSILLESWSYPAFAGVRTKTHLYVEYSTGERELYDYRTDPHELRNLLADWGEQRPSADPEDQAMAKFLEKELDRLLAE